MTVVDVHMSKYSMIWLSIFMGLCLFIESIFDRSIHLTGPNHIFLSPSWVVIMTTGNDSLFLSRTSTHNRCGSQLTEYYLLYSQYRSIHVKPVSLSFLLLLTSVLIGKMHIRCSNYTLTCVWLPTGYNLNVIGCLTRTLFLCSKRRKKQKKKQT
jgi:hypothetical protein